MHWTSTLTTFREDKPDLQDVLQAAALIGDHLWVPWEVKLDMDVLTTFEDLFALLGVSELKPA
jgi:glucose dehydrogenase